MTASSNQEPSRIGSSRPYRALLTAGLLAVSIAGSAAIWIQAGKAATPSGAHVYRAERAAISVILRTKGNNLDRVRIAALVRCTDGRKSTIGFAITGGPGIRIAPGGRFNMTRYNAHELRALKGRVEGDVIRGYFRMFVDSSSEREFEPRCGTAVPNSRPVHFVARRGG